jgi:hypothetical protein
MATETKQITESVVREKSLAPNVTVAVEAPWKDEKKFKASERKMRRTVDVIADADMHTHYWVRLQGTQDPTLDVYASTLCGAFLSHLVDVVMSPDEVEGEPLTRDLVNVVGVVVDFARAVAIKRFVVPKEWKETTKIEGSEMIDFGVGSKSLDYLQFELKVNGSEFKQTTVFRFVPPDLLDAFGEIEKTQTDNKYALHNLRIHVVVGLNKDEQQKYDKFVASFYKIKKPYVYTLEYA